METIDHATTNYMPKDPADKAPKTKLSDTSMDSMASFDETRSAQSKDSDDKRGQLPTFTNEVVVIRPQVFYENEDCMQDNKFMKNSGLKRQSTNDMVSYSLTQP